MKRKSYLPLFFCLAGGVALLCALIFLAPVPAVAHPPQKVLLTYDGTTQTLTVTVTHTRFSAGHYIEKIELRKNGAVVTVQDYKSQPAETFTQTFKVNAVKGDRLEAKATCNKFGSDTGKLTVGQGA